MVTNVVNKISNKITGNYWREIRIVIHNKEKSSVEVFKVDDSIKTPGEAERVVKVIQERLNSEEPILALSPKNKNPTIQLLIKNNVQETFLPANINPDKHLQKYDIIWRKIKFTTYHVAIYLGKSKDGMPEVAHISGEGTEETFRARRDT